MYVWGIPSGRYAPELFTVDRDDVPVSVILNETGSHGEHLTATVISSAFKMTDETAEIVRRFYGMKPFKKIVGEYIQKAVIW